MVRSRRQQVNLIICALYALAPITFAVGAVIQIFVGYMGIEIMIFSCRIMAVMAIMHFVTYLVMTRVFHVSITNLYRDKRIRDLLDAEMVAIGAYEKTDGSLVVKTPTIKISNGKITVDLLHNTDIRKRIESHLEYMSTALPQDLLVHSTYIDTDGSYLTIEYDDLKQDRQLAFYSPEELCQYIDEDDIYTLNIDSKTEIDLKLNTGILITGVPGSGKTYGAQYIIMQAILKGYTVTVLDPKRTYQAFKEHVNFAYTVSDIINGLQDICAEIEARQEGMDRILQENPEALAGDYGYPIHLVVVEEYIALMNRATKQEAKYIEGLIKQIVTTGRQLCVYMMIVTQVSGTDTIDSTIRAVLPVRLVYGRASETIYRTAFGLSETPKIQYNFQPGEGLGMINADQFLFRTPKRSFTVQELDDYMESVRAQRQ